MSTATLDRTAAAERLKDTLRSSSKRAVSAEPVMAYADDPEKFVLDCFRWAEGEGPSAYQRELLRAITSHRRISVRGPHGLGKTAFAAWVILWFALTHDGRDWKIATTASAWQQLTLFLWPEIHLWAGRLLPEKIGRAALHEGTELLDLSLKLRTGQAFAMASDKPSRMEGAHADYILIVFDEAKTIPTATFDALEGAMSTGDAYAIAISTPGEPQGRFYDIHSRKPGFENWMVRHVTCAEALAASRMKETYPAECAALWGTESAAYQNRVLGEFAAAEADGIIPLAWIEAANERWRALEKSGEWPAFTCVGVDVGRGGDATVLALRHGDAIRKLRCYGVADTMVVTGYVVPVLRGYGGYAVVDVIGIGAGVVDRAREQDLDAVAFNAGAATEWKDRSGEMMFANKRAAAWWNLREMLDPANGLAVALPPDDVLTGDLTAPHWRPSSGGRVLVESKEDIRKRIGRSTDSGDAVVQAFWKEPPGSEVPEGWDVFMDVDFGIRR